MENIERVIKTVYRFFKRKTQKDHSLCPNEEILAAFLEGKVSFGENDKIQKHILSCPKCAELLISFSSKEKEVSVPRELLEKVKKFILQKESIPLWLEALLILKEKGIEIFKTTADILFGNEVMPLPVLRARMADKEFAQVSLLKDFQDIRINMEITQIKRTAVKIMVSVYNKNTLEPLEDIRIALFKDDLELESYFVQEGKVVFPQILIGSYLLKISQHLKDIGLIKLELS